MFQFGGREKTGESVEGCGVPSFTRVCSSLEGVKKTGALIEGGGVHSFIGVCSSLEGVEKRETGRRGRGAFFH